MSDVLLFQTNDGGNIIFDNGSIEMTDGMETAVYLALFGGNEDGSQWWGDTLETDSEYKTTTNTIQVLQSGPISSRIKQLVDAIKKDLNGLVDDPQIEIEITDVNKVSIVINGIRYVYVKRNS